MPLVLGVFLIEGQENLGYSRLVLDPFTRELSWCGEIAQKAESFERRAT